MCRELAARGVTLLEADTDGVYFAVPEAWSEADERRVVAEVAALLPPLVQLEFEGRYAAMLSHEPKNYALLGLRRRAASCAAWPSAPAARSRSARRSCAARCAACSRRHRRACATPIWRRWTRCAGASCRRCEVSSRVRLTKTPAAVPGDARARAASCPTRRCWPAGARAGRAASACASTARGPAPACAGDAAARGWARASRPAIRATTMWTYYVRVLRDNFAARLARAFAPGGLRGGLRRPRAALALRATHRDDPAGADDGGEPPDEAMD